MDRNEAIDAARAAAVAIRQLCRVTSARPSMAAADVDVVLADLAEALAALPQAARQLGDILEGAKNEHLLEMDSLTETTDPDLAIDTARLHLDAARDPALDLYQLLDAAHNETAHVVAADHTEQGAAGNAYDVTSLVRRQEDRQPPSTGFGGIGPAPTR